MAVRKTKQVKPYLDLEKVLNAHNEGKKARDKDYISLKRLAKECNVSNPTIFNYQNNPTTVLKVINKTVELTGCSLDELIVLDKKN